jgi:hypothetical protein
MGVSYAVRHGRVGRWGGEKKEIEKTAGGGRGKPVGEYSLRVYQSTTTIPVHIGPPQPSLVFMATHNRSVPFLCTPVKGEERPCPKLPIVCGSVV